MKMYDLLPTRENILETFYQDSLDRNNDIYMFTDILESLETGCSIAIDGSWGSGKTFFVKQTKLFLDANNDYLRIMNDEDKSSIRSIWKSTHRGKYPVCKNQVSVYYDAWENDSDEDPILSLVYSILKSVDMDFQIPNNSGLILTAANILEFFTGKSWAKLIEAFRGQDPLENIRSSKAIEAEVNRFLDALLEERGDRLVIFIDELDRCTPSYAVRLLERIKHYFSNDRITFVFSINTNELQHTIKKCYGNDFDACRYLDRFFDLRISIPPANMNKFYRSINFSQTRYYYDMTCHAVIQKHRFSLRETARYVNLVKTAAYDITHENKRNHELVFSDGKALRFCLHYIVPIILGLKIADATMCDRFLSGADPSPLHDISQDLPSSFFEILLEQNESFEPNPGDQTKKVVTVKEKLDKVYAALFNTNFSGVVYRVIIGQCLFTSNTAVELLQATSLLSEFTDLEVE